MSNPIRGLISFEPTGHSAPSDSQYTGEPETIWALPEEEQCNAVKDIFRQSSKDYLEAVDRDDAKSAQEFAVKAISVISGLFPDTNDPSHRLIISLIAANVNARSGSNNHILLRPGARVPGTKGGFHLSAVRAAAVAAVNFLVDKGLTRNAARKAVVEILADHNFSRRRDDHDQPLPVTTSAIRRWEEEPENFPIVAAVWPGYLEELACEALARRVQTADEAKAFLIELAAEHLSTMFAL